MLSLVSRLVGGRLLRRHRHGASRKIRAARQALLVAGLMLLDPGPLLRLAWAGLSDWRPVLANYSANLTLQASYQQDDRLTNMGASQTSNGQTFRQSVLMNTVGYVYHPNLMLFRMSGTYGEDQNSTDTNDVPSSGRGGFENYELESKIFRAKPYTLELLTKKNNPFVAAPSKRSGEIKEESKADFKYRLKEHRAGLKYHNTTNTGAEQGDRSEEINTIDDFDGFYNFAKPKLGALTGFGLNASAGYQEDGTTNLAGSGMTRSEQGNLSNYFTYSVFNFRTTVNGANATSGDMSGGSYDSKMKGFNEGVNIRLPWDFNSDIDYGTNTTNATNQWTNLASGQNDVNIPMLMESISSNENFNFSLSQSLYDSLETKFTARRDSSESSRLERSQEAAGTGNLESGIGADNEYGLETRYSKRLPQESMATAALSSRNVQRKEPGLNLDHTVSFSIEEHVGVIPLNDFVETTGLSVDVLKDNSGICSKAASNPTSPVDLNKCWLPLLATTNYEIGYDIGSAKLAIKIGQVSTVPGLDYNSIVVENGGLFTFRVNSHRKAADFVTQTNQFEAGLSLFQFISSTYQHSDTTQDGNSGGLALTSKIVSDIVGLGLSLYGWSFHADREWQDTTYLNTITNLTASYAKSRKLWEMLTVALDTVAKKGWSSADLGSDGNAEQKMDGYSYSLTGEMPMPYIQANLRMSNTYNYTKGQLTLLASTSSGTAEMTRDSGINEQTSLINSVSLIKPFNIPWIGLTGSGYVKYNWETQTTTDSNGTSDGGKDRSYFSYGASAARGWKFGSTSINLNANYAITANVFDENRSNINLLNPLLSAAPLQREEETNKTTVMLTIVRQLF